MFCHKSSTNISIDNRNYIRFIQLAKPIFPVKHNGATLCLQSRPHLGSPMCVSGCYTREAPVAPICDLSRIIATRQLDAFTVPSTHYVSNNCIYIRSHLFAGTDSFAIDLMTMKDWSFSQHRPPDPRHQQSCHFFLLAVVIAGDCAMTSIPHAPENMSHKRHHYNLFPHLDIIQPYLWNI